MREDRGMGARLYLVGPPERTSAVAGELAAGRLGIREFADLEEFLDAAFAAPPRAAVVWDCLPSEALDAAFDVFRHHFCSKDCAVLLVNCGASAPVPCSWGVHAVLREPVDVGKLREALDECSEAGVELGSGIPRVLVVDDDPSVVLLGSHVVSSIGMIPLVAFDGAEAIEKAKRIRPDLVLLDINMPHMDGFAVIEALKADPLTSLVPIIVFSARKDDEDKVRALHLGADDYVTKPFSVMELGARIDRLLQRTRTGVQASSTTGLPGSLSVEQALVERIRSRAPLAVVYLDLDHFKSFNDRYGFTRGDSVIRQTADILLEAVQGMGNPDDFVGHIGGDDFVVLTSPSRAVPVAEAVIARFERVIPLYYDSDDRRRGHILSEDRRGWQTSFPLMSLSIAIATNESREFTHPGEVADVAAQLKRYAKSRAGSVWVKDKRANDENGS
ncbi:MAG: response regulator [Deferrisomatales bacterium]|nr:response regulator [Deferrisomatales bacterium]